MLAAQWRGLSDAGEAPRWTDFVGTWEKGAPEVLCAGGVKGLPLSRAAVLAVNQAITLASESNGRGLPAELVANHLSAPLSEVAEVASRLQEAGLVEVTGQNPTGLSVRWVRDPGTVSLYEIGAAVGERFEVCRLAPDVPADTVGCQLRRLLEWLNADIVEFLRGKRLSDVVAGAP